VAEIKMSIEEFQEFQRQRDVALERATDLEKRLEKAHLADPEGRIARVLEAFNAALPVVKFATGNLDPRTVRGWPYEQLETLSHVLDELPTADPAYKELALEFRNFIAEGRALEAERYSADAARFQGNTTLTVVFPDEAARDEFMRKNNIKMPKDVGEMRRRYYVCTPTYLI
jgi:hypothetical protein